MAVYQNWIQMQNDMELRIKSALNKTIEVLLSKLRDIIVEEVYSRPLEGDWQNRTYEFLESWNKQEPYFLDGWYQEISQEGFTFTHNSNNGEWSHGSYYPIFKEFLDDIINDGLDESNFGFPAIEARPYWNVWENWVDINLNSVFYQECIKLGLPIQPVSGVFR